MDTSALTAPRQRDRHGIAGFSRDDRFVREIASDPNRRLIVSLSLEISITTASATSLSSRRDLE